MPIRKKPAPSFSGDPLETWFPGDDAVDLEGSDLVAWCRDGKCEHLTTRGEEEPTLITYRLLGTRALRHVQAALHAADPNTTTEAFRHGIVEIAGERLKRERKNGLWALADSSVDMLSDEVPPVLLPTQVLFGELFAAAGMQVREEPDPKVVEPVTLPEAIGSIILARSFRSRG